MRRYIILLIISLLTFSSTIDLAYAKRFGGGRSFGMTRSISRPLHYPTNSISQPMNNKSFLSKWMPALGGLIAGGLIANLLMSHGLGSGLLTWLAIIAGFFVLRQLFRNFFSTNMQTAAANQNYNNHPNYNTSNAAAPLYTSQEARSTATTNDLEFLREAKTTFLRLQNAYDRKLLKDIREFTTPAVFAEIQMQLNDRGDEQNETEVVSLDAKILDSNDHAASEVMTVEFSGLIRENSPTTERFTEVWHFQREANAQWLVAGIQQCS